MAILIIGSFFLSVKRPFCNSRLWTVLPSQAIQSKPLSFM